MRGAFAFLTDPADGAPIRVSPAYRLGTFFERFTRANCWTRVIQLRRLACVKKCNISLQRQCYYVTRSSITLWQRCYHYWRLVNCNLNRVPRVNRTFDYYYRSNGFIEYRINRAARIIWYVVKQTFCVRRRFTLAFLYCSIITRCLSSTRSSVNTRNQSIKKQRIGRKITLFPIESGSYISIDDHGLFFQRHQFYRVNSPIAVTRFSFDRGKTDEQLSDSRAMISRNRSR